MSFKPRKTALSQASKEFIKHETLQYKRFCANILKMPIFLGIFVILGEILPPTDE